MGIYLSTPNKEKATSEGSNNSISFAASCMQGEFAFNFCFTKIIFNFSNFIIFQGWRTSMEDAHISKLNLIDGGVHLFAVFDGHGGTLFFLLF